MAKYDFPKTEVKWQRKWATEKTFEPSLKSAKKPFYNLMMFPYPSAEGLHVGNMYAFTGADIYGRFKRMGGYDVFQPIGLDGFGIHSENYALKIGTHPAKQARVSEKRFYKQLASIGNGFAWNERLQTYDPEYYKWTQWIFAEMFRKGLAYRKKQAVNWCPSCKTVLADEQVVAGKCERCGTVVVKKDLEQWFFRITEYADRLLLDLKNLDWSERVKIAQENWIGRSEGAVIKFKLVVPGQPEGEHSVEVFTTRPDTLFGATYIAISPEISKKWLDVGWQAKSEVKKYIEAELKNRIGFDDTKEKTGIYSGVEAINPASGDKIPVWVVNYVLGEVGTGAIMAVPAHDERDFEFAKKYNLPIREVIKPRDLGGKSIIPNSLSDAYGGAQSSLKIKTECWIGEGVLINSKKFDGMESEKAKWEITKAVGGERKIQYRLRDWLISRQRYWGPPIPMIYCETCAKTGKGEKKEMPGWYAVPDKDLPVRLPIVKDFRPKGTGESPLASAKSFYEVKCPKCKSKARRETDVSDTFLDSAWYYLRYLNPKNKKSAVDKTLAKKWLPINLYTGGAEHSVLHLLYVRFLAKVFHDWKLVDFDEPARRFRAHGLLIKDGAKMSKSKGNVINPDEYIKKFGADTLRMYLMFLAPFEQGGDFRDSGILGVERFLARVWKLYSDANPPKFFGEKPRRTSDTNEGRNDFGRLLHKTIRKVTEDIESLNYNTAVSAMMILLNEMEKQSTLSFKAYEVFVKLLAPFAPHITEEIYQNFLGSTKSEKRNQKQKGKFRSIHLSEWPKHDPKLIQDEKFTLIIQVNGKVRDSVEVESGISQPDVEKLVLERDKVRAYLKGEKPKKVVYVAGRLINLVI